MATLYQLYSSLDQLETSIHTLSKTWQPNDHLILLGTTVAFIDWLQAYWKQNDMPAPKVIYALDSDIKHLSAPAQATLALKRKSSANTTTPASDDAFVITPLTDVQWVNLCQSDGVDKVITIHL